MTADITQVDAVVVGAGPIGSLVACQLAKFGCKPYIIERDNKPCMPLYGRATTLWPRTLELYDQLDLCDPLLEVGVVSKTGINFRDGQNAEGGLVFGFRMDRHGDTFFKLALHLRQRLTEKAFENALLESGYETHFQHVLEDFTHDDNSENEYPITCAIRDLVTDKVYYIKTKYLIGADGGKSFVRKKSQIDFPGTSTTSKWIRMDALVETDMPTSRALNSIQSKNHGLILFCPIDNGRTRIGYVFNEELQKKYGEEGVTVDVAKEEAKKALQPFSLEFKEVEWFTLYGIGQRVASTFISGNVILAGDACHTHSSGSAQGLNTGSHDAINLAWKLALCIKGFAPRELLESYNEERKDVVQQVIDNDVIISTLISGRYPPKFQGRTESPRDILTEWFDNSRIQAFTLGLGISYSKNNLINVEPSKVLSTSKAGERGPDVNLIRMGTLEKVRLQKILMNTGVFHIVVFTGNPTKTHSSLKQMREYMDSKDNFVDKFKAPSSSFKFTTIIPGDGISASEALGLGGFGKSYFDHEAHDVYGIDMAKGAIIVFRPDGIIGTILSIENAQNLGSYFDRFLIAK